MKYITFLLVALALLVVGCGGTVEDTPVETDEVVSEAQSNEVTGAQEDSLPSDSAANDAEALVEDEEFLSEEDEDLGDLI